MTTKINLAPFQIRTRKGYIWIENTETGKKGLELAATPRMRKAMRQRVARLNTEIAMSRIGI